MNEEFNKIAFTLKKRESIHHNKIIILGNHKVMISFFIIIVNYNNIWYIFFSRML